MVGNMSHVEKQMNRSDLKAYKEGKSENFSMIPGLNSMNKVSLSPQRKKKNESPDE